MLPVSAQTITTSADGLIAGEVKVPTKDGEMPAYRAMPADRRNFPVILVVQEVFGVHEHIKDICRRLAKPATSPSRRSCTRARATPSKYTDTQKLISEVVGQGARRAGHGRPRRGGRVREVDRQGGHDASSASPASAGAGASC